MLTPIIMRILYSNAKNELFSTETLRELYPRLEKNINSLQHRRRLHTLQILSSFNVIPFEDKDSQQKALAQNDVFAQCLAIEDIDVTVENYREKTMQIRKLNTMVSSGKVNAFYKTVAMRLCLGKAASYCSERKTVLHRHLVTPFFSLTSRCALEQVS